MRVCFCEIDRMRVYGLGKGSWLCGRRVVYGLMRIDFCVRGTLRIAWVCFFEVHFIFSLKPD